MPPLPAVANVLHAQLRFTTDADTNAQTHFFIEYAGGPPSGADLTALAGLISTAYSNHFASAVADAILLDQVTTLDLSTGGALAGENLTVVPGTLGSITPAPPPLAALMSMQITRRYRGGRPRMYWPVLSEGDLDSNGGVSAAARARYLAAAEAFFLALVGASSGTTILGALCTISYFSGFTVVTNPVTGRARNVSKLRAGGPVKDLVAAYAFSPRPGIQRRRNQYAS
jgi:hypothetical protein